MIKKFAVFFLIVTMVLLLMPVSAVYADSSKITVPQNTKQVDDKEYMNNTKVTSVTVPNGCAVGKKAFANCVNLKSVTFEGDVPHIDDEAFLNCTSLEKLVFKKPDAAISYIGKKAFANCFTLESVVLPINTNEIRAFAFGNCTSLKTVTVPKNVAVIEKNAIGYMYDEKMEDYFKADGDSEAYVSHYRMYSGKLLEWYSPVTGQPVSMNVVKDSEAESYAVENKISFENYKYVDVPKVTASAEVSSVILKWNKIDNADAYRVSIFNDGKFTEYKTTVGKMCTVEDLKSGTAYTFRVSVLSKSGGKKRYTELISSDDITVTTKTEEKKQEKVWKAPDAPSVTAEASSDSIVLKWKKVENADAYGVYMYNSETGKYEKYKNAFGKSCTVTGLKSGTEYRFKVVSLYSAKSKYKAGGSTDEIVISTGEVVRS